MYISLLLWKACSTKSLSVALAWFIKHIVSLWQWIQVAVCEPLLLPHLSNVLQCERSPLLSAAPSLCRSSDPVCFPLCVLSSGAQAAPSPSRTSVTSRSTRATTSRTTPMPKMASRSSTNTRNASMRDVSTARPLTISTAFARAVASPSPPPARWRPTSANTSGATSAPPASWACPRPSYPQKMNLKNPAMMTWWTFRPSAARTRVWVPRRPHSPPLRHTWWSRPPPPCPRPRPATT